MSMPAVREGYLHESAPTLFGVGKAVFSADKVYRYRLSRTWGSSGTHATWIMLNPSTADALEDDPTIRRCTAFTKAWGLDGLIVINLFALRATDPRELARHSDPVGPASEQFIREAIHPWSVVVAAWGAHRLADRRARDVMAIIAELSGRAPARRAGGRRVSTSSGYHALMVKRRSQQTTNLPLEVRVLLGARKLS